MKMSSSSCSCNLLCLVLFVSLAFGLPSNPYLMNVSWGKDTPAWNASQAMDSPRVVQGRVALLTTWFGALPVIRTVNGQVEWCNGGRHTLLRPQPDMNPT